MTEKRRPPLVLVADDEVHTTLMLERIFEREGYQVKAAHDGLAALEAAKQLHPDLILLDIQMPGMNGFDVLSALRDNALTAGIPTILITAKARKPADVAHGLNLGADDYIYKPFDPRELLARAESKMKARQLEETLQRRTQELQALIRVGEELNHSLEVHDLLNLILFLTLDLLPGNLAVIYRLGEDGQLIDQGLQTIRTERSYQPDASAMIRKVLDVGHPIFWPSDPPILEILPSGMSVQLKHGASLLGILMLASEEDSGYDENHFHLFKGIGRQAALALRNAELYEILASHAENLEDIVAARTAELQSAQQLLIRSEKLASIGHLAASIAHEINNPLQPIRIHLEHMLEDAQHNDPIDIIAIESIQESIERITRIVSQLLEFAGKRSSTVDVDFLDVRRTLEGVINLNGKLLEQNNIELVAHLTTLPPFYGNKDQLEQVFMNLILNAQAAMTKGGKLEVSAQLDESAIVVKFSDTGHGIPADQINRIFDPFFSTKQNGTGLGLFVSYGIIQNHQGSIEVKSEVNIGTTFTIRLPIDVHT
ncbi:MAG: response regulator [Anaerolineae bacterium]|nr:response regulator [Anaerolineae bacterium]